MRMIDAHLAQEIADRNLTVADAGVVQFVLSHTPTIEAEPVIHAKWLVIDSVESLAVCSHCGRSDVIVCGATRCRFCGAKMDLMSEKYGGRSGDAGRKG